MDFACGCRDGVVVNHELPTTTEKAVAANLTKTTPGGRIVLDRAAVLTRHVYCTAACRAARTERRLSLIVLTSSATIRSKE